MTAAAAARLIRASHVIDCPYMGNQDATKIILASAREVLSPLGLINRGRGRNWVDDHDWWIVNVEIQPSGWSKGSYLNVGVQWLWKPFPAHAFEYGDRVMIHTNGKPAEFVEFETRAQFANAAHELVSSAAREVLKFRELFARSEPLSRHCAKRSRSIDMTLPSRTV